MDERGFFLGSTPFYPGYFFDQQQQQQFGPFMNELHSQLNVGEGSQSRPGSASSDTTSSPTSPLLLQAHLQHLLLSPDRQRKRTINGLTMIRKC